MNVLIIKTLRKYCIVHTINLQPQIHFVDSLKVIVFGAHTPRLLF